MLEAIDDYRLVRPLGHDGATFLAHDRFLDRAVVLSFLPEAPDARAERLGVARAFARATHPNLGRVHRVREGGARPYVVAAFARGERLDRLAMPLADARVLELGRGLAGALAALHDAGVAHGAVRADRVVISEDGTARLVGFGRARGLAGDAGEASKRADLSALLTLLGSMAERDLQGQLASLADLEHGVATAEELRRALEMLARPTVAREALSENPYRGLRAFEREHAGVFFGREREVLELVERLRGQPWLLVAGRSGTGKSSLVRAGLAPAITAGGLGECESWDVATMVPGARPLDALARAIAPLVDHDRDALSAALRTTPALAGRLARARTDRGLLIIVDQLEELMTLAGADERDLFCAAIEHLGALAPGVRVVFTLRGDFLDRLADLGALGRDLVRAAYVLAPMSPEGLRAAIVSPARARGVELETSAMVEALVDEVRQHDEALPLLSFVLAELWGARDPKRRVIPEGALRQLGGAVASLARHGDLVLTTLRDGERVEARRILLALVTAAETRARRTAENLVAAGGPPARAALEALVRGRLVVAGETYEIAHEALARAWPRLRAWLDEASEARAVAARLAIAAREWVRLGRGPEGLGRERLLRDLAIPGALEGASEEARAFVEASRAALRRVRRRRLAVALGVPLLVALLGVSGWLVSRARHRAAVAQAILGARSLDEKAEQTAGTADQARTEAVALFEKNDLGPAEERWKQALAREQDADRQRREVGAALDVALSLDPRDPGARALYADVTLARLFAAERLHNDALLRELRSLLAVYDDGSRAAKLHAPAHVRVESDLPGASLTLARYREDPSGRFVESDPAPLAPGITRELEPGSYVIVAASPERYPTRYPFFLRRGEESSLRIVLPRAADVHDGMIYVPAGRTFYGSGDDEAARALFVHEPAHDVEVGAFLIARTEVTAGDYLAFIHALPESEREERRTNGLVFRHDGHILFATLDGDLDVGQPFCRKPLPCVDWFKLPVDGANREDGEHYTAWLARSGRLPGARLCTDREWERAARGADERRYPNGNGPLGAGDACSLATYGRGAAGADPCAAGTHPASRSPFGVDDMSGSECEWVADPADIAQPGQAIARGWGFNDPVATLVISNRAAGIPPTIRQMTNGIRVCADAK